MEKGVREYAIDAAANRAQLLHARFFDVDSIFVAIYSIYNNSKIDFFSSAF
jgi:hypothetical protein